MESDQNLRRQRMEAIRSEFRMALKEEREAWQRMHSDPPRQLSHYTTLQGMEGIVSTGVVWASDPRFMNDSTELSYARDLINRVAFETMASTKSELPSFALERQPGFANPFEHGVGLVPFIFCLCEEPDLLSQWRGYSSGQPAFSLGMDISDLAFESLPPLTLLRKVLYDEKEQEAIAQRVVGKWLVAAESMIESEFEANEIFPYPAIWCLQEALAEQHLCFKNPAFLEEQEWRLIKLVNVPAELRRLGDRRREAMMSSVRETVNRLGLGIEVPDLPTWVQEVEVTEGIELKFRRSSLGLVPYVELPLRHQAGIFTDRLPLSQIIQGPTGHPDIALQSLQLFLESHGFGFPHTDVRASNVPLRQS